MDFGAPTAFALLHRAVTGRDGDGNDQRSVTVELAWGAFDPGGSSESNQDQQRVITQPAAFFLDSTVSVAAADEVIVAPRLVGDQLALDISGMPVDGTRYQAVGPSARWVSPFDGWEAGVVVRLEQVAG